MKYLACIAVLSVALALVGCSSTTSPERLAANKSACENYGFRSGTDAYATCMMELDLDQKQEDRSRIRRVGNALTAMSASMAPRRPVTCSTFGSATRTYGTSYGNATTTCY